ncbi:MAG: hypothetical protein KF841_13830 [Phycisphaerae bacterium]|nr:hypothetical protein [Phycisphaerae bacterium]
MAAMLAALLAVSAHARGDETNRLPTGTTASQGVAGRGESQPCDHVAHDDGRRFQDDRRVQHWWFTMGWGFLILVTFFAGATAIIVFSRRFRTLLRSEAAPPTPSEDLWAMHKTPPIDENVFEEFETRHDAEDPIEFEDGFDEKPEDDDSGFTGEDKDDDDEPPGR